jgi:hypothetical protein
MHPLPANAANLVDDRLILNTGDHLGITLALRADRHIDKVN